MARFTALAQVLAQVLALGMGLGGASAACGLDAGGAGDLFDGDGGAEDGQAFGDAAHPDAAARLDSGFDANAEAGDATPPPLDASSCVPAAELCNDGIDNDCNGLVDCADPACQPRFACTAPVPAGWVLSEYAPKSRPACDPLYLASRDVIENPKGAPATCACTCAVDAANTGRCDLGVATLLLGADASCTPQSRAVVDASTGSGGACGRVTPTLDVSADTSALVIAPGYVPGACSVNPTSNVPPITSDGNGRVCATTAALGGGCGPQAVCAPVISAAFGTCVSHSGILACPAGYPNQHILGAQVVDTRACSACSCVGTGSCEDPTLTLYPSGGCGSTGGGNDGGNSGGTPLPITADGSCQPLPPSDGTTYSRFTYSATPTPSGCATIGAAATGGVSVGDAATVCCP